MYEPSSEPARADAAPLAPESPPSPPQCETVCIAECKSDVPVEPLPPQSLRAALAEVLNATPSWEFGNQAHEAEYARAKETHWAVKVIHRLWIFVIGITMALVGGVLVVFLGGFALSYHFDDIPLALQRFDADERRFWVDFHTTLDQAGAGKLNNDQLANQIEQEFLPRWRVIGGRFTNLESIPPGDQGVVDFFKQYIQLREEAMGLHIEALRTGDAEKFKQRNALLWRADQLRQQQGGTLPIR
ncbi:MAG: hypothetical protein JNM56_01265 [Planctomycetia bacterium]|nr:hypothetical protein [Planctomycetia bacterium]